MIAGRRAPRLFVVATIVVCAHVERVSSESADPVITDATFVGQYEPKEEETRADLELEYVVGVVSKGPRRPTDPKRLEDYNTFWKENAFRKVTALGRERLPSDDEWVKKPEEEQERIRTSHRIRMGQDPVCGSQRVSGLICLRIERKRLEHGKLKPNSDVFDDVYYDTIDDLLDSRDSTLRLRRRWKSEEDPRRLMISYKSRDTRVPVPNDIKAERELEIRRDFEKPTAPLFPGAVALWERAIASGEAVSRAPNREEETTPVSAVYGDLKPQLRGAGLRLKPRAFVRTFRARWHYQECSGEDLDSILDAGVDVLERLAAPVNATANERRIRNLAKGILDWTSPEKRFTELLEKEICKPSERDIGSPDHCDKTLVGLGTGPDIEDSLSESDFEAGGESEVAAKDVERRVKILEIKRLAAEAMARSYLDLAKEKISEPSRFAIEEAAQVFRMRWFHEAREFYVPDSKPTVDEDFIIDTIDLAYLFGPCAWRGTSTSEQTPRVNPKDASTAWIYSNDVQLEVDPAKPLVKRVVDLKDRGPFDPMRVGAEFVLDTYLENLEYLAELKQDEIEKATSLEGWKPLQHTKGHLAIHFAEGQQECN